MLRLAFARPSAVVLSIGLFALQAFDVRSTSAAAPDDGVARIEAALERQVELQYLDTPLGDVANHLAILLKVPVRINSEVLAEEGLGADMPITHDSKELTVAEALNRIIADAPLVTDGPGTATKLDWTIRDGVLLFTTPADAEAHPLTRVYPVADLAARPGFAYDALVAALQQMTSPDAWADNGGAGRIKAEPRLRSIVVSAPYRRQRQVADVLKLLVGSPDARDRNDLNVGTSAADRERIDDALRTLTEVQYLDTPLSDVAINLRIKHQIPIQFDYTHVAAVGGKGGDYPVTIDLNGMPLASALNQILAPFDLTWTVVDGVVLFTTPDGADAPENLQVREYVVGDLYAADEWETGVAELVDTLTQVVRPSEWVDAGGTVGVVVPFAANKSLLVRHSEQGHRAIGALLAQLRAAKPAADAEADAKQPPQLYVRFYPVADLDAAYRAGEKEALTTGRSGFVEDASILVRALVTEVLPDSWHSGKPYEGAFVLVDRLTRSLVVRQTRAGHKAVQQFLDEVRANLDGHSSGDPPRVDGGAANRTSGGFGGGGGYF